MDRLATLFYDRYECHSFLDGITLIHTNMTITNRVKITLSPVRLRAVSSVRIPTSTHSFRPFLPTVSIRPLNLFSASSVDLHGASNTNVLRNNLRVRLSPIKSPVLRKYLNPFKRLSMYPSISKYNAKSCNCCQHLCTNIIITSSVNGRTFHLLTILIWIENQRI